MVGRFAGFVELLGLRFWLLADGAGARPPRGFSRTLV